MDSYDNDGILLLILDDDLFFTEFVISDESENEQEQNDVEKVSEQPNRA